MLSIELNTIEREQYIVLQGQLKGIEALELRQKVANVIENRVDSVCLDIQALQRIDLTGFNAIVILKKEVEQRNKIFKLLSSTDGPIDEYLHLSKLNLNQTIAATNTRG